MRLSAFVEGVGVLGPGLPDWPSLRQIFAGERAFAHAPTILPVPSLLPPVERRRTGRVVRLAIAVALEATQRAQRNPAELASIFSSSGGDGHNCHEICQVLASNQRDISPTRFANSVHNASAGYWSIATGATAAANVLCAYDASFGAGLLEALTQVAVDRVSLLLVSYDTEYPEPLHAKRPLPDAFGVALVLTPEHSPTTLAQISMQLVRDGCVPADVLCDPGLEALRTTLPAARCLPLLQRLARYDGGVAMLEYLDATRLKVSVEPCT